VGGSVERGDVVGVLRVDIDACVDQKLHGFKRFFGGSEIVHETFGVTDTGERHQSSGPVIGVDLGVGSMGEQIFHDFEVGAEGGAQEWRGSIFT
jgi:hypothetical protein